MKTSTVQIAPGRVVIHTEGLRTLSKALGSAPSEIRRIIGMEFKGAAQPIATRARELAMGFADSGDFAASIRIDGGRSGVYLRSTDPGGGVIDFANQGAVATRATDPDRLGKPVGVPDGEPSRALFPAIDDRIDEVAANIAGAVDMSLAYLAHSYREKD